MRRIGILLILGMLLTVGMVHGAATILTPTPGAGIGGTITNWTIQTTMNTTKWCDVTCTSSKLGGRTTALSSFSFNATNMSDSRKEAQQLIVNGSTSSSATSGIGNLTSMGDSNDWICTGTCYNTTASSEAITAATYVIDNGFPNCTMDSALVSKEIYSPDQVWQLTGANATSATLYFGSQSPEPMQEIRTDIFTFTDGIPEGIYTNVKAITSDGTNKTTCTVLTNIEIDSDSTLKQIGILLAGGEKEAGTQLRDNKVFIIAIIVVILAVMIKRRKK